MQYYTSVSHRLCSKLAFFFVFMLFVGNTALAQEEWKYFSSYEGNFKVLSPNELTKNIQTITTELGELDYYQFHYEIRGEGDENYFYMINYVDYPEGSVHSDSTDLVQVLLEASQESAIEEIDGTLRYSDAITLQDFPGRIWRIDYNEGAAVIKTKAFVINNRFYLVQVATTHPRRMDATINKFLDSFQLLNKF